MQISYGFSNGQGAVRLPNTPAGHTALSNAKPRAARPTVMGGAATGLPSNPAPKPTGGQAIAESAYRAARGAVRADR